MIVQNEHIYETENAMANVEQRGGLVLDHLIASQIILFKFLGGEDFMIL